MGIMSRKAVAYLVPPDRLDPEATPSRMVILEAHVESDQVGRQGLGEALGAIARGEADTLLVLRLSAAAGSFGALMRLLDWLAQHQASLMALDMNLDTAQPAGRQVLNVLREIDRWAREPEVPRRPPGRPGLGAATPELARRIAALRDQGRSLHAIADALNAEGVPTPRGGTRWRASSVQAALGYRRPRPPVPGAPPPKAGRGGRRPPKPPKPGRKAKP
jgi:hypothetical protein